ncbi:MAG: ATP-binding protein [bacterium]|nr:ATP-binding protein [bacterium]
MIPLLAIILGIVSVLTNNPLFGFAAILALIFEYFRFRFDVRKITQYAHAITQRLAGSKSRVTLPSDMSTSQGMRALDALYSLSLRSDALQWENKEIAKGDSVLAKEVRIDDFSIEDFLEEIKSFIKEKFRCQFIAIAYKNSPTSSWQMTSDRIGGDRFREKLYYYADEIKLGVKGIQPGLKDCLDETSLFQDFSVFGVRHTLTFPFSEKSQFGCRGLLWIGYDDTILPTKAEVSWARSISEFISLQLNTKRSVNDLHHEIRKAHSDTKLKTQFFANLSHDVRTPLNNLKNILTIVKFEEISKESLAMLDSAIDNCDHMTDIVEDILFYAQFQVGELKCNQREVSLSLVLDKIVKSFEASARIKGLSLKYSAISDSPLVNVDLKHLRRIVSNLLSNAIKYTISGNIDVSVERSSHGRCSVVIQDTGVGLKENEISRLFTPFTRFDKIGVDGVGLGLALSKILADLNGAEILVTSKFGLGSKFELSLLAVNSDINSVQSRQFQKHESLRPKILVVDDDRDYLNSLSNILHRHDFEILSAGDVDAAITILNSEAIAVVITDASFPGDGVKAILEKSRNTGSKTIVVTGREVGLQDYRSLGAADILIKPVEVDLLVSTINKTLGTNVVLNQVNNS